MIKQPERQQASENYLKKILLGFVLFAVSFGVSGCDLLGLSTLGGKSSGANNSTGQGTLSKTSDSFAGSFPVKADLGKIVRVTFTHADFSKNKNLTYVLIQNEVPISKGKIAEGESSCVDNRIKRYKTDCQEEFDVETNSPDDYEYQVKILRKNFRDIKIVLEPKSEPAEVIFLQKKHPQTVGNGVVFFDVYLKQDSLDLIDKAENRNYATPLNLSEVLSDCGQLQPIDTPDLIAEAVQLGGSVEDIKKAAEQKRKNLPPDSLDPIAPRKIPSIVALNPSKENLIEKLFDSKDDNNPFTSSFEKIGSNLETNHISSGNVENIALNPSVFNIKSPDFLSDSIMTLIIMGNSPGAKGSPLLQVKKGDNKYFYAPSIASKTINETSLKNEDGRNLGISAVEFEPPPATVSDPWCGFTPESKPAIYLYPTKPTVVLVKLNPQGGWISASDPKYSPSGWKVLAMPSGNIYSNFKKYPHLFYEAMLPTPKMSSDYEVFDKENLSLKLTALARRLSLNEKESSELASYWTEKLPQAPFYKVGLMPEIEIDRLEPFSILPKPDSVYRLRLLFKPISQKIPSTGIENRSFARHGFTVVEWGGFVLN